jgi:hypothetical protein
MSGARKSGYLEPHGTLLPMEQYAREFYEAWEFTERLGLEVPNIRLAIRKDCLKLECARGPLQRLFDRYSVEEIAEQALAINIQLLPDLSAALGVPLTLTGGWFETARKPCYQHGRELIRELLTHGIEHYGAAGIPMHFWFTSPAAEVLDVLLPAVMAVSTGNIHATTGVIYLSNRESNLPVIYHPTILGADFLEKIGAVLFKP